MRVWFRIPFSLEKNLGKSYNEEMAMIPEGDAACFQDGDVLHLQPDFGNVITHYATLYPDAILICSTNRIHEKAEQLLPGMTSTDIKDHLNVQLEGVTAIHGFVSGFLMVVPKSVWHNHKFAEQQVFEDRGPHNLLGVDNDFTNRARAGGVKVLKIPYYVWHTYRLLNNGSKQHLL